MLMGPAFFLVVLLASAAVPAISDSIDGQTVVGKDEKCIDGIGLPSAVNDFPSQLMDLGLCFNKPPPHTHNFLQYAKTYQDKCHCLASDNLSGPQLVKAAGELNADQSKRIDESSLKRRSRVGRAFPLGQALSIELEAYNLSAEKYGPGEFKGLLPSKGVPANPDLDLIPRGQCFSMHDYLRTRRAPDETFHLALSQAQQFNVQDWDYATLRSGYDKVLTEITQSEDKIPAAERFTHPAVIGLANKARLLRSKMSFLYKNPSVRAFLSSKKDISEKRRLFALIRGNHSSQKSSCLISTAQTCKSGVTAHEGQVRFETDLAAFYTKHKISDDLVSSIEAEEQAAAKTQAGEKFADVGQQHLDELTLKHTGTDPKACLNQTSPQKVNDCTKVFAYLCPLVKLSREKVLKSEARASLELERSWDEETNPDASSNTGFKLATEDPAGICHSKRYSRAWGQRSFMEWKNSVGGCGNNYQTLDRCSDTHKLYADYLRQFPTSDAPEIEILSTSSSTPNVSTDFTTRTFEPLPPQPPLGPLNPVEEKEPVAEKKVETAKPEVEATPPLDDTKTLAAEKTEKTLEVPVSNEKLTQQVLPTTVGQPPVALNNFPPVPLLPPGSAPLPAVTNDNRSDAERENEVTKAPPVNKVENRLDQLPSKETPDASLTKKEVDGLKTKVEELRQELNLKNETEKKARSNTGDRRTGTQSSAQQPVKEESGPSAAPVVSGNLNPPTSQMKSVVLPNAAEAVEKISRITEEVSGVDNKTRPQLQPVAVKVGTSNILVAQSILTGKQVDSLAQLTGEVKNQPQFILNVNDLEHFKKLKDNNSKMVAMYIQQYIQQAGTSKAKNWVLVLTGPNGESVYLSVVSENTRTYAQRFTPTLADQKILRTAELKWLQQILRPN